jgi:hypothetical protein
MVRLVSGDYGSDVDDWTPWEKLGLWIIFVALGVLIVWLTFAFWPLSHGV